MADETLEEDIFADLYEDGNPPPAPAVVPVTQEPQAPAEEPVEEAPASEPVKEEPASDPFGDHSMSGMNGDHSANGNDNNGMNGYGHESYVKEEYGDDEDYDGSIGMKEDGCAHEYLPGITTKCFIFAITFLGVVGFDLTQFYHVVLDTPCT
ncbi:hypothetical protein EJ08DRAFT_655682 [Tothia fuscella]|uniref:Uncharacterized protein n=1 Tax=Tothia fuscella TaxID=1048955 RepID=A0A9P4U3I6_9PEZI|nr:hypothetical protein EJ08DRAFT_655682 [Tothia fuscella]